MTDKFETVCVLGLGYIGLPTAATLAAAGLTVKGVDIREDVVDTLNAGKAHFSEPDLELLVRGAVESGKLKAYTEPQPADAFIITVPTPINGDKSPDMSFVDAAARSLMAVLAPGNLVLLESTSPLGTTAAIADIVRGGRPDLVDGESLKISLAYCPERILPGQMVRELVENDRIVGGLMPEDAIRASDLYKTFVHGEVHRTDAITAEMVKLIENAYRDVNIAFANEVAAIGESHGIDPWEAINLANRHPRVNILSPGPGVGGHCIAVDPWFLITQNRDLAGLMNAARIVNDSRPATIVGKIEAAAEIAGSKRIACLGLAYKPDVDDLRESPALEIVRELAMRGYEVSAVEPHVDALPSKLAETGSVTLRALDEALAASDVVALLVAHKPFADVTAGKLGDKAVVDAVGLWRWQG
jgi:UDP-N-acetyl-D-mannosaminuronic acid dehydrogenase